MICILGDDLLLWRTHIFSKAPGGKEIPWHQDRNYWPLEPEIVISAWLAIDRVTIENSCVQVIPGSHRLVVPHVPAGADMEFGTMADLAHVDVNNIVNLELLPGQFFLFNERTLHHSEPNRSSKRRMGMSIRVITPQVRVLKTDSLRHNPILISGRDNLGFNTLGSPPLGSPLPGRIP
jgi:ectoine hydroxylase-related dioxygenase (phytanoyl-CoA dioxygenase family)